jgi:hypothetical protein
MSIEQPPQEFLQMPNGTKLKEFILITHHGRCVDKQHKPAFQLTACWCSLEVEADSPHVLHPLEE